MGHIGWQKVLERSSCFRLDYLHLVALWENATIYEGSLMEPPLNRQAYRKHYGWVCFALREATSDE